jgi:hypothetical protein
VSPRHLRGRVGLELDELAASLGVGAGTLRLLEATPTSAWTVEQLARYAGACGYVLKVHVVRNDGREEELT